MLYGMSALCCVFILRCVQGDGGLPEVCSLFQNDFRGSDMDLNALSGGSPALSSQSSNK